MAWQQEKASKKFRGKNDTITSSSALGKACRGTSSLDEEKQLQPWTTSVAEGTTHFEDVTIEERRPAVMPRKRQITLAEFERYGGTGGCTACMKMALADKGQRTHPDACRQRFERVCGDFGSRET